MSFEWVQHMNTDIHSSQDVCDDCEMTTYVFEKRFPEAMSMIVGQIGLKMSTRHFYVAVRASSSRSPSHSGYRKGHHVRQTLGDPEDENYLAREYTHPKQIPMDLKLPQRFMLHYDAKARRKRGPDGTSVKAFLLINLIQFRLDRYFLLAKKVSIGETLTYQKITKSKTIVIY